MKVDLTIAICSNRDYDNFLKPTLDQIESFENALNIKYEILVYGPKNLDRDDRITKFYVERYAHGPITGYNYLTWASSGEVVAYLTDDMSFSDNFFDLVEYCHHFKIGGFKCKDVCYSPFNTTQKITADIAWNNEVVCRVRDIVKTKFGEKYAQMQIPVSRFLCAEKTFIKNKMGGYLFHPSFKYGAGDQYLGLWSWFSGYPVKENIPVYISDRMPASNNVDNHSDAEQLVYLVDRLAYGWNTYV